MKRVGVKPSWIANVLQLSENEVTECLREIEGTPFRRFYDVKNGYYFGHVLEAIKYYKIVKNHK